MNGEYTRYRVLREADGSEAVPEADWLKVGVGKRAHIISVLADRIERTLTDAEHQGIRDARGGCRCQDPGAMPPCGTCTEPLSLDEIETVVLVRRAERAPVQVPEGWGDW